MALCICQQLDKQYLCVSALLETFLLWESDCMCPCAQAMQRCERVPTNSSVISGARASTVPYRTDMKARRQLPASLVCLWEPMEGQRYGPAEPGSLLYRSTKGYEAEQAPPMDNYVHLCTRSVASWDGSLMIYDIAMKMSELHFPESCSYMKSWLSLKTKEPKSLVFTRKA